jgi:hypothetical protein
MSRQNEASDHDFIVIAGFIIRIQKIGNWEAFTTKAWD